MIVSIRNNVFLILCKLVQTVAVLHKREHTEHVCLSFISEAFDGTYLSCGGHIGYPYSRELAMRAKWDYTIKLYEENLIELTL